MGSNSIGRDQNEDKPDCYSVFPIRSIVLCINSDYFEMLLVDSGMKETKMKTVTIKVNKGEGKYLEMLIEAFYNQDLLSNIDLVDFLSILDVAARFSCLVFIKQGLEMLTGQEIQTVEECDTILQYISRVFEVFDNEGKCEHIKSSCLNVLSKILYPLELKFNEQKEFFSLNYVTVMFLLASKHGFTFTEDDALLFVHLWLQRNTHFQTPEVIGLLLNNIRCESLTTTFLCDEITVCDKLFSKWHGYSAWFIKSLKYHSLSWFQRNVRGIKNVLTERVSPSTKSLFFASKHFVYDTENKCFEDRGWNDIILSGLRIEPIILFHECNPNNMLKLKIRRLKTFQPVEPVVNFHNKFKIYFAFLPGNIEFNESMLQCKRFVQRNIRKGKVIFKCKQMFSFHAVAKIDKEIMDIISQFGLNLVLFSKLSLFHFIGTNNVKSHKKQIHLNGFED